MTEGDWGSFSWNEAHFPESELDGDGDTWGFRWRGMEKWRHQSYLRILAPLLNATKPLQVLDIGCALCDFTQKAWNLNRQNRIYAMDISPTAIKWSSRRFPGLEFRVGAIPEIVFEGPFDMVFCLEVLCYLSLADRKKTIDNIHGSLSPAGKLLFSGVLDGGVQHHTKEEVFDLICQDFEILVTTYNHWWLYRSAFERPGNRVLTLAESAERILSLPEEEFLDWCGTNPHGFRSRVMRLTRALKPLSKPFVALVARVSKALLSSRAIAAGFHHLAKALGGQRRADEIVILAERRDFDRPGVVGDCA